MKGGRQGQTKKRKPAGLMREVLAANVHALMQHQFIASSNKPMALAKKAQLSLSSVQRVLDQDTGASIDTVEAIAKAFGVSVYQLMVPNIDPTNPPVIAGVIEAEKALYQRLALDMQRRLEAEAAK